jgi:hypothetical protein
MKVYAIRDKDTGLFMEEEEYAQYENFVRMNTPGGNSFVEPVWTDGVSNAVWYFDDDEGTGIEEALASTDLLCKIKDNKPVPVRSEIVEFELTEIGVVK